MRKLVVTLVAVMALVGAVAMAPAPAKAEGWAVDFDSTFNSKYVWRGALLVDDWVIQPSVNVAKGGFSFNVWGNYEPTDETGHQKQFTEIDLTAEYAFALGDFSIPVGVIHYMFPNTEYKATTEIYTGVSYDWIISPSATIYADMDQASGGLYLLLEASYSHELPVSKEVGVSVDLGAGVAYANEDYLDFYYGVDDSGWSDAYVSLAVPISVMDGKITFTPAVTYTALIDSDLKDSVEDDSNTYFGLSVTFSF